MFRASINFIILLLVLSYLTACDNGSTVVNDKGIVVINYYKIINHCPEVQYLDSEIQNKEYNKNMLSLLKTQEDMFNKMDQDLNKVTDKESLDFRKLEESHLFKIKTHQEKIVDLSMNNVIEKMKAFDDAYRLMGRVALVIAKKMNARCVIPVDDLISPNPKIEYPKNVIKNPEVFAKRHSENFINRMISRKVFAYDPSVDITSDVLDELRKNHKWK